MSRVFGSWKSKLTQGWQARKSDWRSLRGAGQLHISASCRIFRAGDPLGKRGARCVQEKKGDPKSRLSRSRRVPISWESEVLKGILHLTPYIQQTRYCTPPAPRLLELSATPSHLNDNRQLRETRFFISGVTLYLHPRKSSDRNPVISYKVIDLLGKSYKEIP